MKKFYLAGSMNAKYPSKAHIMDNDGFNLCGAKGYWIESTLQQINKDGFIEDEPHLSSLFVRDYACKKCIKKFKKDLVVTK